MKTAPHPLQVMSFFLMGINFAIWQPFVWWRGLGAAVMLAGGVYGWWLLRRSKREKSSREPSELE